MLWYMLTHNFDIAFLLDIIFFIFAALFGTMLIYFRYKLGAWWHVANAKLVAIAIGRDKLARIIIPKLKKGQFLDLDKYGKIFMDPASIYRVQNMPGNQSIVLNYLPYAIGLDAEKLAAAKMISEAEKKRKNPEQNEVEVEGGKVVFNKVQAVDEQGNIREMEQAVAVIEKPVQISAEEIERWQTMSYNPILLDVAVQEEARARMMDEAKTITQLRMMMIVVMMLIVLSLIFAFIR